MPETLDEVLAYYDRWLAFQLRYQRVPGIQAAVYAEGRVAFSAAYGLADVERRVPLTEQHLFRIASHSKTFTATAVLQLVEQGKLRLDDKASAHVTELVGEPIGELTVRDLLNHVGGVTRDSLAADFWQLDGPFPDRDQLLAILREPSSAILGANERFKYSNIGYGLAGLVIEAASGQEYNQYVATEIVGKLGLTDLGPELDPARATEYVTGYSALAYADERVPIDHVDTRALSAATGFYGTARDVVSYLAAHFPGDERLLTDASKRIMQHPAWAMGDEDWPRYGLGVQVVKIGDRVLFGHGGGYPGHITRSMADAKERIAVSVLTNTVDGPANQLVEGFYRLLDLASAEDRPAGGPDLSRFAGRYANLWGVTELAVLGGRLYALDPAGNNPADRPTKFEADGDTLLVVDDAGTGAIGQRFRFTFDPSGRVATVRNAHGLALQPINRFELPPRIEVS